jgi:hypothetical protein
VRADCLTRTIQSLLQHAGNGSSVLPWTDAGVAIPGDPAAIEGVGAETTAQAIFVIEKEASFQVGTSCGSPTPKVHVCLVVDYMSSMQIAFAAPE